MKIINKKVLSDIQDTRIVKLDIYVPHIASKARAGQFVVLMVAECGERIPLTIVGKDEKNRTITLIFQELGLTTKLLGRLNMGDSLYAITGPLGHATEIKNYGKVILVGGGVGIAEIYPLANALKEKGNHLTAILGARTKELIILEAELKAVSDELFIATDDGSYGKKGFTTDILKELLTNNKQQTANCGLVYAVGPIPMMKKVSSVTKEFNLKTVVSLNSLMVDATGMCGGCRVTVGSEVKFTCVDGPEFDAHLIDWDELEKRNRIYEDKEKHICKLNKL
jgi:ferredoxin--NADP+ reductase